MKPPPTLDNRTRRPLTVDEARATGELVAAADRCAEPPPLLEWAELEVWPVLDSERKALTGSSLRVNARGEWRKLISATFLALLRARNDAEAEAARDTLGRLLAARTRQADLTAANATHLADHKARFEALRDAEYCGWRADDYAALAAAAATAGNAPAAAYAARDAGQYAERSWFALHAPAAAAKRRAESKTATTRAQAKLLLGERLCAAIKRHRADGVPALGKDGAIARANRECLDPVQDRKEAQRALDAYLRAYGLPDPRE